MTFLYILFAGANQWLTYDKKIEFSKLEWTAIGASILTGIDISVTPSFTGGQSLHEICGIDPTHQAELATRVGEYIFTYGVQFSQLYRNIGTKTI